MRSKDFPAELQDEHELLDSLFHTNIRQLRTIPVKNIDKTQPWAGIKPQRFGLVTKSEFGQAGGKLRRAQIIEDEKPAKASKRSKKTGSEKTGGDE